jgi:succinate dehydrogenase/fumarate reductase-like Fe-S protein
MVKYCRLCRRKKMACPWDVIQKFTGPRELEQFYTWMREQIDTGEAEEAVVPDMTLAARCFRHCDSGQLWIVTRQDGPLTPGFRRWA